MGKQFRHQMLDCFVGSVSERREGCQLRTNSPLGLESLAFLHIVAYLCCRSSSVAYQSCRPTSHAQAYCPASGDIVLTTFELLHVSFLATTHIDDHASRLARGRVTGTCAKMEAESGR